MNSCYITTGRELNLDRRRYRERLETEKA